MSHGQPLPAACDGGLQLSCRPLLPLCCSQVAADLVDDTLVGSGLLPAVRYAALSGLLTHDALCVPRAATVWAAAAQAATPRTPLSGLDLGVLDRHRWWPSPCLGAPLPPPGARGLRLLSAPREAWHFDVASPQAAGQAKHLELELLEDGTFNAVSKRQHALSCIPAHMPSSAPHQQTLNREIMSLFEQCPS